MKSRDIMKSVEDLKREFIMDYCPDPITNDNRFIKKLEELVYAIIKEANE